MSLIRKLWLSKKRVLQIAIILTILFMCYSTIWIKYAEVKKPIIINPSNFDELVHKAVAGTLTLKSSVTENPIQTDSTNSGNAIVTRRKLILLWTSCYGDKSIEGWFIAKDTFQNCPYTCEFTKDISRYNSSDALFFEGLPTTGGHHPPVHDLKNQIWVFFRIESPLNARSMLWKQFENNFNWTMSYRRDSDIYWPAARFVPMEKAGSRPRHKIPTLESLKNKTIMAAWMNSNCGTPSRREDYAKILGKYIQIDTYGNCGKFKCDRNKNCYEELAKKYKFWIAFENSICADYVTEKMYFAMKAGMVPIVYGHPSFKDVIMNGSYININDFDTAQDLAKYLKHLDTHPEKYLKYFEWMNEFVMLSDRESMSQNWCNVCTKLNTMDFEKDRKFYPSVGEWFNKNYTDNNFCYNPVFDGEGKFKS